VKDRSDELSTADLAGQSAGSGAVGEHAVRDEPADQTGERPDAFPGDRAADADYGDDRYDRADDRAGGMHLPGGTPADRAAYADDDATMASDRAGRADDTVTGDRAGYADDTVTGDRAGYADDRGFDGVGAGVGGRGVDATAAQPGYETGQVRQPAATGTGVAGGAGTGEAGPLLAGEDSEGFRARWTDVQTGFVDAPRQAVEKADALVAELMQHLAKSFADERSRLESQWDRGEDIPTDDLRTAFQRYRSFFERLLST
jgi:hypothetical protein